jgi:hypothetical protein
MGRGKTGPAWLSNRKQVGRFCRAGVLQKAEKSYFFKINQLNHIFRQNFIYGTGFASSHLQSVER